jgi:DHA1 family bicyclomycin/chloramphenicol resistance-like MFS transporter
MVAVAGLMFATLFAYVAGAPFLLQERARPFAADLRPGVQRQCRRSDPDDSTEPCAGRPVRPGPGDFSGGAGIRWPEVGLLITAVTDFGGLLGFMLPLFFVVSAAGLSFPNAPAIALSRHGDIAGTAAAVLGAVQFMIGGRSPRWSAHWQTVPRCHWPSSSSSPPVSRRGCSGRRVGGCSTARADSAPPAILPFGASQPVI